MDVNNPASVAESMFYVTEDFERQEEIGAGDMAVDYSELIEKEAFLGETPFNAIIEGLEEQFNDYIKLEDETNYVDVFYTQLHASYDAVRGDDGEEHPVELTEALDKIHQSFIDFMTTKFELRLALTIMDLESEDYNRDDVEFEIRRLYEFFILGAKQNFTVVITADAIKRLGNPNADDDDYFRRVNELLPQYSPLFTTLGPMEFLRLRGDQEMVELFDNNRVTGNFLKKYSPKFYANPDFEVDVVNSITIAQNFRQDYNKIAKEDHNGSAE